MKIPIKIKAFLWLINSRKDLEIYKLPPERARKRSKKLVTKLDSFLDYKAIPMSSVKDQVIEGRSGQFPIRIYQAEDKKDLPVILYFHGGGFVINDIDSHDKICRRIARDNQAIVISVGYRLAPEFKFPTAVHDSYDALLWTVKNKEVHQGDTNRIVVMGDSAGGNLAAAICLMSKALKGPEIAYQVLIYPCTDGRLQSASIEKYGENYLLTKKIMEWFINLYKSKDEDIYDPYMSMLLAEDLSNLPPAFVCTAEYDPLKDEGYAYAERLREAGNEVIYKDYPGMIHGFIGMPKLSKHILVAYQDIQNALLKVQINKTTNV